MELQITRPYWLAALVTLPLLWYYARHSLVHFSRRQRTASLVIRQLLVVAVVLALCGLKVTTQRQQQFVVFAVDNSRSIQAEARRSAERFIHEAMQHAGTNRVAFLPFAVEPGAVAENLPEPERSPRYGTNLAAAILAAEAAIPSTYVPQIVLLSDGNQTAGDALATAQAALMPITTVPLPGRPKHEVYVSAVHAKPRVRLGEPFDVEADVVSTYQGDGTVQVLRRSEKVAEEPVHLAVGKNRLRFRQRIIEGSQALFTVRLTGFRDTIEENNQLSAAVAATGKPRILLIDSRPASVRDFAEGLRREHIDVEVQTPQKMPGKLAELQAYDLLMLSNVPAASLAEGRMEVIRKYVRDFGGGLITVGGDRAFTPGGYRDTTLEEVLPVLCHVAEDKPRPTLAMVLVIDSSGSMKDGSGSTDVSKLELAKQATRQAVEELRPRDKVGVIAFEDRTTWISEIHPCSDKQHVLQRIDTITAGGGTNMQPAVEKAALALNEALADRKHIIVLTDGLSHPGDFAALGREIAASGITVSTVAVGRQAAGQLLQEIADVGGGHYYACKDATAVPAIFTLETIGAGQVGITEGPFSPQVGDAVELLEDLPIDSMPTLLGYVETRLKPSGRLALATESGDPLLAWWPDGAGISVAFTSDIHDRWAAAWLRWPQFGPFWARVVQNAMRKDKVENRQTTAGYADELRLRPTNQALLQAIARAGDGQYAVEPADVFASDRRTAAQTTRLWPYLLAAAVIIFVIDVTLKRIDWTPVA